MNEIQVHRLADLLLAIEAEMRRLALWEETPPPPAALASTMPFCYDTLEFSQWLQWILLARLRDLLEQDAPLPRGSQIHPLAEYTLVERGPEVTRLLDLIRQLDELLS